jgi:putative addiction module killer protein
MDYNYFMIEVIQSETFKLWREGIKDRQAVLRISARLSRVMDGNFGDVKPVRDGVNELRIDYGPGYRVYFKKSGLVVVVLLGGGTKRTQDADIDAAVALAKDWKD